MKCVQCGKQLVGRQIKWCSDKCRNEFCRLSFEEFSKEDRTLERRKLRGAELEKILIDPNKVLDQIKVVEEKLEFGINELKFQHVIPHGKGIYIPNKYKRLLGVRPNDVIQITMKIIKRGRG